MLAGSSQDDSAKQPGSLPVALLLAGTGGLLDAATYVLRGHVFATALTGNVVLLGLSALAGRGGEIVPHAAPIAGFLTGVVASSYTRSSLRQRAHGASLLLEVVVLAVGGLLPAAFPNPLFTAMISFAGGLQVASFRRAGPWSYSSTFLTGDLRDTGDAVFDAFACGTAEARARARLHAGVLAAVCVVFLAGAGLGAVAAGRLGARAFWVPVPLLAAVLPHEFKRMKDGRR